jgi:DNA adenine methylase
LRWAGGKRWLARRIAHLIKVRLKGTYREPFLGAGSMFFAVEPARAALSDINAELIEAWKEVAAAPDDLLRKIQRIPVNGETYLHVRASRPRSPLGRATRFIYLNRTCYGGLYRTNRNGEFNVPFGGGSRTPALLWERDILTQAQAALCAARTSLFTSDFQDALGVAGEGDVCFLDPTYVPAKRGPFDRYNANPFSWQDQIRVREAAEQARARGAVIVISNVGCPQVRSLYGDGLVIDLSRAKSIGNAGKNASSAHELLVVYDDVEWHARWRAAASLHPAICASKTFRSPDRSIIIDKSHEGIQGA